MHYRWNQVDPQSPVILRGTITVLGVSRFSTTALHQTLAFISGLCIGVSLGWAVPPRPSLKQLAVAVAGALILGTALTMLHR